MSQPETLPSEVERLREAVWVAHCLIGGVVDAEGLPDVPGMQSLFKEWIAARDASGLLTTQANAPESEVADLRAEVERMKRSHIRETALMERRAHGYERLQVAYEELSTAHRLATGEHGAAHLYDDLPSRVRHHEEWAAVHAHIVGLERKVQRQRRHIDRLIAVCRGRKANATKRGARCAAEREAARRNDWDGRTPQARDWVRKWMPMTPQGEGGGQP